MLLKKLCRPNRFLAKVTVFTHYVGCKGHTDDSLKIACWRNQFWVAVLCLHFATISSLTAFWLRIYIWLSLFKHALIFKNTLNLARVRQNSPDYANFTLKNFLGRGSEVPRSSRLRRFLNFTAPALCWKSVSATALPTGSNIRVAPKRSRSITNIQMGLKHESA